MTESVIILSILLLSLYDAYIYLACGYDQTITAVARRWDNNIPMLGKLAMLGLGLLIGHLFL